MGSEMCIRDSVYRARLHEDMDVAVKNAQGPHDPYFLKLKVNGKTVTGIRDTGGNCGPVLVDKRLVSEKDIIPGKIAVCSGAFDGNDKRHIQLCQIKIRCPRFGQNADIVTEAGICEMPENIQCNLGNLFFSQNPQLKDVIAILGDSEQIQGETQTEIDTNEFQSHNSLQSNKPLDLSVGLNESHDRDLSTPE